MGRIGRLPRLAFTCSLAVILVTVSKDAFAVLAPRATPCAWERDSSDQKQGSKSTLASGIGVAVFGLSAVATGVLIPKSRAFLRASDSVELFSPAKVNLFLRIIRRRPDGYHDLASLFHTVAFGDKLVLEVACCVVQTSGVPRSTIWVLEESPLPVVVSLMGSCEKCVFRISGMCAGAARQCRAGSARVQPAGSVRRQQ